MPNSVALIRDCPHPEAAKKLIDFLLSEETEILLAKSRARQVPLGPVNATALPPELSEMQAWAADGCDLLKAASVNQQVLDWLMAEHTGK